MCFFLPLCAFDHGILHLCIGYNIFCTYMKAYICTRNACSSFGCSHKGEYPLKPQIKMEFLRISAVLLYFCIVPRTTGSQHTLHSSCMSHPSGHECALLMLCLYKAMLFYPAQVQFSSAVRNKHNERCMCMKEHGYHRPAPCP